jgi:LacI family transcriptional regulator
MISSSKTTAKIKNGHFNSCLDTSQPSSGKRPNRQFAPAELNSAQVPQVPRVAVMVDTSNEWGRRLVKGIVSYAIKHGPWKLWVDPRGQLGLPVAWQGDGIIASLENRTDARSLLEQNCPIVNVSAENFDSLGIPSVTSNVNEIARVSFSHFKHRGLNQFAFVGPLQRPGVRNQAAAYQATVRENGFGCDLFDCVHATNVIEGWQERRQSLVCWLQLLPKPIGLLAWNAHSAIEIVDACSSHGISVPDDVSVLAGEDDGLLCSTSTPTLSGVLIASEQIGFAAARRLHRMLDHHEASQTSTKGTQFIDPIMVNARESTDSLAINDPDLLSAVRFIRTNACCGITVQEVADSVPIGRRSLERKFKDCFGRTPLDEIQRLRLGRVRELLMQTDLPISKIAKDAGFGTPEYMTTMFKCRFGLTPLKFRSQSRAR